MLVFVLGVIVLTIGVIDKMQVNDIKKARVSNNWSLN